MQVGTVLPAEEAASLAGFPPARRVSNLGRRSTALHASREELPPLTWEQGQAHLCGSRPE